MAEWSQRADLIVPHKGHCEIDGARSAEHAVNQIRSGHPFIGHEAGDHRHDVGECAERSIHVFFIADQKPQEKVDAEHGDEISKLKNRRSPFPPQSNAIDGGEKDQDNHGLIDAVYSAAE